MNHLPSVPETLAKQAVQAIINHKQEALGYIGYESLTEITSNVPTNSPVTIYLPAITDHNYQSYNPFFFTHRIYVLEMLKTIGFVWDKNSQKWHYSLKYSDLEKARKTYVNTKLKREFYLAFLLLHKEIMVIEDYEPANPPLVTVTIPCLTLQNYPQFTYGEIDTYDKIINVIQDLKFQDRGENRWQARITSRRAEWIKKYALENQAPKPEEAFLGYLIYKGEITILEYGPPFQRQPRKKLVYKNTLIVPEITVHNYRQYTYKAISTLELVYSSLRHFNFTWHATNKEWELESDTEKVDWIRTKFAELYPAQQNYLAMLLLHEEVREQQMPDGCIKLIIPKITAANFNKFATEGIDTPEIIISMLKELNAILKSDGSWELYVKKSWAAWIKEYVNKIQSQFCSIL